MSWNKFSSQISNSVLNKHLKIRESYITKKWLLKNTKKKNHMKCKIKFVSLTIWYKLFSAIRKSYHLFRCSY